MSKPKIAVIGSGQVAQTLAKGFQKHGYGVVMGNRTVSKLADFGKETGIEVVEPAQAAARSEIVILAIKGTMAETVVTGLSKEFAGKIVVDTTNPIADAPPVDGVLTYFTSGSESLMERLQKLSPSARFVKAFNSVGSPFMVDPSFSGGKPTMFIAGNDADAKAAVASILTEFGWESEDMGKAASARPIEALCQLWCARGFNGNKWGHAFKLLTV
jgi:8-hydroxy-5-deazaflavin:NADPH oxidoreductase